MMKTYGKILEDGVEAVSLDFDESEAWPAGIVPLVKLARPEETETHRPEPYLALAEDEQSVERRWQMVAKSDRERRAVARETLRAEFLAESDEFLGLAWSTWRDVGQLLDLGKDAAARAAILALQAPSGYTLEQTNALQTKKTYYADQILALPALSSP